MKFNGINKRVFEFSLGPAELLCTCASAFAYVSVFSCLAVFCEALVPVHLSGFCILLHFAILVCAPAPVHALS